jgi:N-acetylglutamate synthase-like GNAT family acetyltransferase
MASAVPGRPEDSLRRATDQDAGAVAQLLTTLGYPCTREDALIRLNAFRDEPGQELWLAFRDGQVVGLSALQFFYYLPLGARTCRITALAVVEQAQRRGVGKTLLLGAETRARQNGAVRIELTSAAQRGEAHAFYRACGYDDGALRFMKRLGDA